MRLTEREKKGFMPSMHAGRYIYLHYYWPHLAPLLFPPTPDTFSSCLPFWPPSFTLACPYLGGGRQYGEIRNTQACDSQETQILLPP